MGRIGILDDDNDIGVIEKAPTVDDFENNLTAEKQQKDQAKQMVLAQAQAAQAAAMNPANWTHQQSVDYFKNNPPRTPQEEAQVGYFLKQKKQQKADMMKILEETDKAVAEFGKQSLAQAFDEQMKKEVVMKTIQDFGSRVETAVGTSVREIAEHPLFKVGPEGKLEISQDKPKVLKSFLAGFSPEAYPDYPKDKITSLAQMVRDTGEKIFDLYGTQEEAVKFAQSPEWQKNLSVLGTTAGRTVFDFLSLIPSYYTNPATYLTLKSIGEGVKALDIPSLKKDILHKLQTEYKMPEVIDIKSPGAEKFQSAIKTLTPQAQKEFSAIVGKDAFDAFYRGEAIQLPARKIVTLTDRPWWGKIKETFGVKPLEKQAIQFTEAPQIATKELPGITPDLTKETGALNVGKLVTIGKETGKILKIEGENAVIGLAGKEVMMKLVDLVQPTEGKVDYGMQHRPTEGPPAHDLLAKVEGDDFSPKDIYEHPEWYANNDGSLADRQTISAIKKLRGKPDAEVTIYRSAPNNELNKGDWVSFSKAYAKGEGIHPTDSSKDIPVYSFKVKASDVKWAGDSLNEFGYFGKDIKQISPTGEGQKPPTEPPKIAVSGEPAPEGHGLTKEEIYPTVMSRITHGEKEYIQKAIIENKSPEEIAKELDEDITDTQKGIKWAVESYRKQEGLFRQEIQEAGGEEELAKKQELKDYLKGKLKPELAQQGEYSSIKHLPWIFAQKGQRGYTLDELMAELQDMGFAVENDNDVMQLIKDSFNTEIQEKAAVSARKTEKQAQAKIKSNLAKTSKQTKTKPKTPDIAERDRLIKRIKEIAQTKLLSSSTISRIKQALNIEGLKKSGLPELKQLADFLDTLKEGDKFLSEQQLLNLQELIDNIPQAKVTPKRILINQLGEKSDLMEGLIVGKIPNELFPTVDVKEGHPLVKHIVDKAEIGLNNAEEEVQRRDTQLNALLKKAEASRKRTLDEKAKLFLAPQNKEIFEALGGERSLDSLTPEERAVVAYLKNFFKMAKEQLELDRWRKQYVPHLEKPLLEKIMTEGISGAIKDIFSLREKDTIPISIVLELENIIGSEKFFKFALPREGYGKPTTNIRRIVHDYSQLFETKKALDAILPEGQTVTKLLLKGKTAQWMKQYLQNLKGRGLDFSFRSGKGGWAARLADYIVDLGYIKLLALNWSSALKNIVAGEANSFIYEDIIKYLTGKRRFLSNPKRLFKMAKDYGILEGTYAEYSQIGIGRLRKIQEWAMIGQKAGEWEIRSTLFASYLTPEEWATGRISDSRIREIKDVIAITQGIFSKAESPLWVQTWYGRFVLQMNRWRITNAMLTRRLVNGAKEEWARGERNGPKTRSLSKAFILYGIGMYLSYELGKNGWKKAAQIAQSMAEEINNIVEILTLKPIVDALTANPTLTVLKEIAFTIQELAAFIGIPGVQVPKKVQFQHGIEDTYVAPLSVFGGNKPSKSKGGSVGNLEAEESGAVGSLD